MQQACPVNDGELVARGGDRVEPRGRAAREHVLEAGSLDQLAQHVPATALQGPERQDARYAEALEAAQRDRLTDERADLVLAGVAREQLQREDAAADPVADGPDLAAPPRAEAAQRLVARR